MEKAFKNPAPDTPYKGLFKPKWRKQVKHHVDGVDREELTEAIKKWLDEGNLITKLPDEVRIPDVRVFAETGAAYEGFDGLDGGLSIT